MAAKLAGGAYPVGTDVPRLIIPGVQFIGKVPYGHKDEKADLLTDGNDVYLRESADESNYRMHKLDVRGDRAVVTDIVTVTIRRGGIALPRKTAISVSHALDRYTKSKGNRKPVAV